MNVTFSWISQTNISTYVISYNSFQVEGVSSSYNFLPSRVVSYANIIGTVKIFIRTVKIFVRFPAHFSSCFGSVQVWGAGLACFGDTSPDGCSFGGLHSSVWATRPTLKTRWMTKSPSVKLGNVAIKFCCLIWLYIGCYTSINSVLARYTSRNREKVVATF